MMTYIQQRRQETGGSYEDFEKIIGNSEQENFQQVKQALETKWLFSQTHKTDAVEELLGHTLALPIAYYKIVFPFWEANNHWYVGEIWGKKKEKAFTFTVRAHNPYGCGNFEKIFPKDASHILACLSARFKKENLEVRVKFETSPFNQRQNNGDWVSCGPVMVNDLFKVILGKSLNVNKPYEYGAILLRKKQVNLVKNAQMFLT